MAPVPPLDKCSLILLEGKNWLWNVALLSISKLRLTLDFIFPFQFWKAVSPCTVNHERLLSGLCGESSAGPRIQFPSAVDKIAHWSSEVTEGEGHPGTSDHSSPQWVTSSMGIRGPCWRPFAKGLLYLYFITQPLFGPMGGKCNFQSPFSGAGGL